MPGIKSTKLETEKRVFTIQGWIINGIQDYLILKNIEQEWGVGRRQSKNLLQKAYKIWHEDQEATIEQKRALRIAELKQNIRSMKDQFKGTPQGMTAVNQIQKEINKLEGLYPVHRVMLQGDKNNPVALVDVSDPISRDKRIAELVAKATK
ncbi:hypothetical protein [Flavobacterium crassostreae]|uniref:Uncharacterized protein n=1 Tax=Flavobacterium crassostreae TaxID=1763534 RepID=A0A1B9E7N5_9FLAO|nr:hypothetical protein [Flavobacterium crassostreae]OCB77964.1 hypothetical protein LPBF_03180 [Flavobacterium crassostreae]